MAPNYLHKYLEFAKVHFATIAIATACVIIVLAYSFKAVRASKPQQISYSNWLNSTLSDSADEDLSSTIFSVQFPESLGAMHWQLSGTTEESDVNQKLKRLMDLAKASSVFSEKASSESKNKIIVKLINPDKSFAATLTKKQIQNAPELQTFFKLFELYANNNLAANKNTPSEQL